MRTPGAMTLILGSLLTTLISSQNAGGQGSRPYSAGVVITTFTQRPMAGPSTLDLLVLWRGAPGWYLKPGPRRGGGGGSSNTTSATLQYGGVSLRIDVVMSPRTIQIQGKTVPLNPQDANVILVDDVDSANGPSVVGTFRIDPSMPDGELRIESVLRRSKEIVSFLRCDQELLDAGASSMVKHNCDLMLGR